MNKIDATSFLRAESELVLDHARQQKANRTKSLGSPIKLPGAALALVIRGNDAWIAENTAQVRVLDLETSKTKATFRGHTGPVTSIAFMDKVDGSGDNKIMITGSWDQTIKIWDIDNRELISSTSAHLDFVKTLLIFPSLKLLVSSGSDKIVRLWNVSSPAVKEELSSLGSISSHTRPVECLDGQVLSDRSVVLYTADTMGVIKIWTLEKEGDSRWRSTLQDELGHHRTRINEMVVGNGYIWTASTDETVQVHPYPSNKRSTKPASLISHTTAVKALLPLHLSPLEEPYLITGSGDVIRVYEASLDSPPELLGTIDAHWHDVTILKLWMRLMERGHVKKVEPWIVSASLDGTLRKWKLEEVLHPPSSSSSAASEDVRDSTTKSNSGLTEDEERELNELMNSGSD